MMTLGSRKLHGTAVVDVEGKLIGGPGFSDDFHNLFRALLDEGEKYFAVNLEETSWANSQGVGMLIGAYTSARNAGGDLVLSGVGDRIRDILAVTRLHLIFKVFDTEDEAVGYLLAEVQSDGEMRGTVDA